MAGPNESKRRPRSDPSGPARGVAGPPLPPGLWLVATPIGHADDITLRAIDILGRADVLTCEDTRRTRKLMDIHGISRSGRPMIAYHDRNGAARRPAILQLLDQGKSVAYASDAGTPMIADPGYRLVEAARAAGHPVHVAPGASSVLAALCLAGLPTDRFLFAGFLPQRQAARRRAAANLAGITTTLVWFESPRRLGESLADLAEALGPERKAAVVREITKLHEETLTATLGELADHWTDAPPPKGEIVLVVGPPSRSAAVPEGAELDAMIRAALAKGSVKDAASAVAEATGLGRRDIYRRAVELAEQG